MDDIDRDAKGGLNKPGRSSSRRISSFFPRGRQERPATRCRQYISVGIRSKEIAKVEIEITNVGGRCLVADTDTSQEVLVHVFKMGGQETNSDT